MHFKLLLAICVLAKVGEGCSSEKETVSKGNDTTTASDETSVVATTTDDAITDGGTQMVLSSETTTLEEITNMETATGRATSPMETTNGGATTTGIKTTGGAKTTGVKTTGNTKTTMAKRTTGATTPGTITDGGTTTTTVTRTVARTTASLNFLSNEGELCSDIGKTAILSVKECESSVPWIQKLYPGMYPEVTQESVSGYPKGCYVFTRYGHAYYGVLFNKHITGSPESRCRQVCKPEATISGKTYFLSELNELCSNSRSETIRSSTDCRVVVSKIRELTSAKFMGEENHSDWPKGCYVTGRHVYWNTDSRGSPNKNGRQICVTSGTWTTIF